jgi:hypothetical protein
MTKCVSLIMHKKWALRAELLENRRQSEFICVQSAARW